MPTLTTNYRLQKPDVGGDADAWGGQINDSLDIVDRQLKLATDGVFAAPATAANPAAAYAWNVQQPANRDVVITLTRNITITLSNDVDGGFYSILFVQDSTGGRTVTYPATWHWIGGTAQQPASGAGEVSLLSIRRMGARILAAPMMRDLSRVA